ncbi:hypothetical protein HN419_03760 [Candidatus Woesearchaeota archaeon]|jgi:hypothetical protein|nr:hypothetical protein [Candidatus Woesearchaeota archaeon]MBT3538007.1 hypothetical protein [Candidatus Woesearchaeota archaeon]MBT4698098.1 hypothetical protein [Candidatus Woesearchaeota archaeon]MBT4717082.1 hypothetical protein [Candidatus Woesearchaeota archaeon]MBT7105676.1 hypothetical protein [Candidatus Woesearchaeota archaeon]
MVARKHIILLLALSLILIAGCGYTPECGNAYVDEGEDWNTCCLDVGCLGDQTCQNNTCINPECGECQFLDERKHACADHECCDDSDCTDGNICEDNKCQMVVCGDCQYLSSETNECVDHECCETKECKDNEICTDHACETVTCGSCQYVEDHVCAAYACCKDSECDDDKSTTIDTCDKPTTADAKCMHESVKTCTEDSDCEDGKTYTEDVCLFGNPSRCVNFEISDCKDDDDFCPDGCSYSEDDDCSSASEDCDDLDCFLDALEDCDYAEVDYTAKDDDNDIIVRARTYMEIKGENSDDECEVFFETKNIDIDFTDDYIEELEDDGHSDNEIDDMEDDEQDEADDIEGEDFLACFANTNNLETILEDWDDDKYDLDDLDDYVCEESTVDCDEDLQCFLDELADCDPAELIFKVEWDNNTVDMEITTEIIIEKETSNDDCRVSFETTRVALDFKNSYIDDLEDDGYSDNEIDDLEEDAQDDAESVEGDDWKCDFPDTGDLEDILEDWEDGDYELEDLDDSDYDCDGDGF